MKVVNKKIEELKPYEKNPRKNDDAVKYVANSIKEFGFKVPIIIDKDNVIVAGHTRYKACQQLGIKEVPCVVADDLTEEQIKAFRIADNKVSDYSIWDNQKLLEELEGLDDVFTGFEISDVFGEELNESDNSFLSDIVESYGEETAPELYVVSYKCANKEEYDDIMNYIESIKNKYE